MHCLNTITKLPIKHQTLKTIQPSFYNPENSIKFCFNSTEVPLCHVEISSKYSLHQSRHKFVKYLISVAASFAIVRN